ncbi:MAG TPA: ribonuclease H-like domain-containing protein, partial [Vicinamibacterales bacterium]|nr:ribonuclease H-like domain-containing protein [Vicinamibacterales bacterium]
MRDLTARLRAIVRTPAAESARELTYVPDLGMPVQSIDAGAVARQLDGEVRTRRGGSFVAIDRTWDAMDFHGKRRVGSYEIVPTAPLTLLDPRLAEVADWASRIVFFDIETTGLSGGAGTIAFLVGCGWFEDGGFKVRQLLLTGPAGEPALLEELGAIFDEASLLVTYNGRTFDIPTMDTRWAFHRQQSAAEDLPHFDMLPPARRLWGRPARMPASERLYELPGDAGGCTLGALERLVLGFHRLGDVGGFEIPVRYFQFLRTGDPSVVEGVLEHNRHDLISLAAVTSHALMLAADGPDACRDAGEQLALGRLYERAGDCARAEHAFTLAGDGDDSEIAAHASARLAALLRRASRHDEAEQAWRRVIDAAGRRRSLAPLAR